MSHFDGRKFLRVRRRFSVLPWFILSIFFFIILFYTFISPALNSEEIAMRKKSYKETVYETVTSHGFVKHVSDFVKTVL